MKKLLTLFSAVALVLGINMSARASTINTITFDESWVSAGTIGDRFDGTQVSTQYMTNPTTAPYGVEWADIYPGTGFPTYTGQVVCQPGEHSGGGYTSNYLWIYGNNAGSGGGAQTATVTFSTPSDYFSIDYRRPNQDGTFDFTLYLDGVQVSDSGSLSWATGQGWKTYTPTTQVMFDKLVILESDKSLVDNLKFSSVPIPSAFWLLGSGLLLLIRRRKN